METKFTPWRRDYIARGTVLDEGCVLCGLGNASPEQDAAHLVLYRAQRCYVVQNLYPYNSAHLMVTPFAHSADLPALDDATAHEFFELTRAAVAIIATEYRPQGFNVGMNLGQTAGAGIADHLHMHIVPRWSGDSNFMPIVGGTKLIPEELEQTYERLRPLFARRYCENSR